MCSILCAAQRSIDGGHDTPDANRPQHYNITSAGIAEMNHVLGDALGVNTILQCQHALSDANMTADVNMTTAGMTGRRTTSTAL